MLSQHHVSLFQNGFAIFALSVTVFSIAATAALLAYQVTTMTVDDTGYGVRSAAISSATRAN